jgi:vancomycin resistance protein VanW
MHLKGKVFQCFYHLYLKYRRAIGRRYYILKRTYRWYFGAEKWTQHRSELVFPIDVVQHQSILLRKLKAVDMHLQHNKIVNLKLAAAKIDGIVIHPGETFSFWKTVSAPTASKGYLTGLVLQNGKIGAGIGGGLCQMGNLLYWMALHTPLTIAERWRHSYDVFPDEGRTLPFGSGATLAYNYIDLQLRNDTSQPFQIKIWLSATDLHGSIYTTENWPETYEIIETDHQIRHEAWGGYSRHNRLERRISNREGTFLRTELVTENHALMMYQPFLEHAIRN